MAYKFDTQYTPCQDIGQADAMPCLRFKIDDVDLVAVAMDTFEKTVFDADKLRKEMH